MRQSPGAWRWHADRAAAPLALFVAGAGGLLAELGRDRFALAPDTLGNGDSCAPAAEAPDIAYFADATCRLLEALGLGRVDLYGAHTGARIATEIALTRPDRVRKLVLDGFNSTRRTTWTRSSGPMHLSWCPTCTPRT